MIPKISTIIPTYQRPLLLKRAILSVLNQSYKNVRVLVCDNHSADETAKVVAELKKNDDRIDYVCHKENMGGLYNFNYGFSHVATEYFSIMSDDDVLLPDFYEAALKGFEKYPDIKIFAGAAIYMDEKGRVLGAPHEEKKEEYLFPPSGFFRMMESKDLVWTAMLFKSDVLDEVGLLRENVGILTNFDFQSKIAVKFPILIQAKPFAIFVSHDSSATASLDYRAIWPYWFKVYDNLIEQNKNLSPDLKLRIKETIKKELVSSLRGLGIKALKENVGKDFKDVVDVLKNLEATREVKSLNRVNFVIRLPFGRKLFLFLNNIRKIVKKLVIKGERQKRKFSPYADFLKIN